MVRDLLTPMHLLLIVLAFVILFGGKKLSDVGKGLGEGIRNFKTSLKGDDPVPPATTPTPEEKKQA